MSLGLQSLPYALLISIGSFLDTPDCLKAARICKSNQSLAPLLESITEATIGQRYVVHLSCFSFSLLFHFIHLDSMLLKSMRIILFLQEEEELLQFMAWLTLTIYPYVFVYSCGSTEPVSALLLTRLRSLFYTNKKGPVSLLRPLLTSMIAPSLRVLAVTCQNEDDLVVLAPMLAGLTSLEEFAFTPGNADLPDVLIKRIFRSISPTVRSLTFRFLENA